MTGQLTREETTLLHIAASDYRVPGSRERAFYDQLGLTPTAAYQQLVALLHDERALAHDPVNVYRLRRQMLHRRVGSLR